MRGTKMNRNYISLRYRQRELNTATRQPVLFLLLILIYMQPAEAAAVIVTITSHTDTQAHAGWRARELLALLAHLHTDS